MSYKKEHLLKLLNLIEEVASQPESKWFKDKLFQLCNDQLSSATEASLVERKINAIHDYLAIDISKLIDYSAFEEPSREQLFRDCLEMIRHQKGTPNHKIDFGEFCRYAHLQAEEMINYYLNKVSDGMVHKVDQYVQQNCASYNPRTKPTLIHHIGYTYKLNSLKRDLDIKTTTVDMLWFLNDFRNELSHRNSFTNSNEDKCLVSFEKAGFVSASINIKTLSGQEKDLYNKGSYILKKRKADYSSVYTNLEQLKKAVVSNLFAGKKIVDQTVTIGKANPGLEALKEKMKSEGL